MLRTTEKLETAMAHRNEEIDAIADRLERAAKDVRSQKGARIRKDSPTSDFVVKELHTVLFNMQIPTLTRWERYIAKLEVEVDLCGELNATHPDNAPR